MSLISAGSISLDSTFKSCFKTFPERTAQCRNLRDVQTGPPFQLTPRGIAPDVRHCRWGLFGVVFGTLGEEKLVNIAYVPLALCQLGFMGSAEGGQI